MCDCGAGQGQYGRGHGGGQGRRVGGEVEVHHAEPVGLGGRVGAEDGADDGRGLVPAGNAGHRHRRHGGEGDAAGQAIADGPDRHSGAEGARAREHAAEKLRLELYDKVNRLGIGAQGLGGLTTVLDVKVLDYPTHAANLPVAMIPNCAATRHAHIVLDGSGPVYLDPPSLEDWPKLTYDVSGARRVNLDTVTRAEAATWKPGEVLLLTGKLLTGRDAAHKRMTDMLSRGEKLPVDFRDRFIYYVGPGGPGARRGGWSCRSDDGHAHGQVHAPDAGRNRIAGHGGQGRARAGGDRGDPRVRRGVSDGGGRRGISGVEGDSRLAAGGLRAIWAWKRSTSSTCARCR